MSKNDITGDDIKTKVSSKEYLNNYDRIFGNKGIIECYYSECKYHAKTEPFCFEGTCRATEEELIAFGIIRQKYLERFNNG